MRFRGVLVIGLLVGFMATFAAVLVVAWLSVPIAVLAYAVMAIGLLVMLLRR